MMKKTIFTLLALALLCSALLSGCNFSDICYNNDITKDEAITVEYTRESVEHLKQEAHARTVTYTELRLSFRLQCVRKVFDGYYAVLRLTDGAEAFVFINDSLEVWAVLIIESFMTHDEFQTFISTVDTLDEMLALTSDMYPSPVSFAVITVHFVKEGMFVVKFKHMSESNEWYPSPIVDEVLFYTNEEAKEREMLPYILEIDKVN